MKQTVIAALLSTTYAAAVCKDAYTDLADAELKAANSADSAAKGSLEKQKLLLTEQENGVKAQKLVQDPIDAIVAPFTVNFEAATLAKKEAEKAYVIALENYGKE
jgi:hypothetical protein